MSNNKKGTFVFDFDGVIHRYREGWKDGSIYDSPNMRIVQIMSELMHEGYSVAIVSTRKPSDIVKWCSDMVLFPVTEIPENCMFWDDTNRVGVTNRKIPALLYIDDRGFRYQGDISLGDIKTAAGISEFSK